ncbi:MAG: hypothetical protein ACYDBV_08030 [Nitrospiria bacterium]
MICARCRGLMVSGLTVDEGGRAALYIWRCIPCGEIIDPVILFNRRCQPEPRKFNLFKPVVWIKPVK